ncbi:MAG: ComEC/Rec2 family competence protein [Sphingomicrobium sp.]
MPLWFAVAFGAGIAAWLWLPGPRQWTAFAVLLLGLAAGGLAATGRAGRALSIGGLALVAGCLLIWWRSSWVDAPRLDRPRVATFAAKVESVESLAAKDDLRLTLVPASQELPPKIRISVPEADAPAGIAAGARIRLRARLMPPPPMPLPGAHDFARDFWFKGIGATGRAIGPIEVVEPASASGIDGLRARLDHHIRRRLPGPSGAVATAFATGDQNAISDEDAEAMRRSGLAHLLSVGGLHITAAVGLAMLLTLRLLALSERLALRFNLVMVAAGAGALAGIGYTLLTGAQVPMVRSCIAALLVLAGLALGRDPVSLRLLAVAALAILAFRPEALAGASFQMSFAAIIAIIALHRVERVRGWFAPRDDGPLWRALRTLGSLLLTGLVVEVALIPFALFHFHKAGLYGVVANMVAIPWTTFVIMPLEALAIAADGVGLGAPLWIVTSWSIDQLLGLAHWVGGIRGAVAALPTMPDWAFAAFVLGLLWTCLWTGKVRLWGALPFAVGAVGAAMAPVPTLLITGDGQHVALVRGDGVPVLLRSRSGDFVRDLMSEASGFDGEPAALEEQQFARCSRDACVADISEGGRAWRLLAIRSRNRIDWSELTRACADADVVVADRWLPRGCQPRWLKLDREALMRTGGVAVYLGGEPRIETVSARVAVHPWAGELPVRPTAKPPIRSLKGR